MIAETYIVQHKFIAMGGDNGRRPKNAIARKGGDSNVDVNEARGCTAYRAR